MSLCAQYHCDKHVCKLIIECALMLCTAHHVLDGTKEARYNAKGKRLADRYVHPNADKFYKPTHVNHPCSIWVRRSLANYEKLYELFVLLCREYTYRYGRIHKTETKLLETLKTPPTNIPDVGFTNPPIAITNDDVKVRNEKGQAYLVKSYRNYYNVEKKSFAVWTNRGVPKWFDP